MISSSNHALTQPSSNHALTGRRKVMDELEKDFLTGLLDIPDTP